jgi:acetamidase/formamidase
VAHFTLWRHRPAVLYQTMRPSRLHLAAATLCLSAFTHAQTTHTLLATPSTVAWGFYDYHAKPVLTVHSGDTVVMQTASTCGNPQRLLSQGVKQDEIPAWLGDLYDKVPKEERGPGGHILTGPVAIAEAQPGDTLEVRIVKIDITTDFACNGFGKGHSFLSDDFPYAKSKIIPLDRAKRIAHFAPNITIPLHPFFGSMGIAPPESAGHYNSAPPWVHGGNMDNKDLVAGATVYYPVWAPGALFEAGDGHAGQGNGEVDITALETFLTGTFQFIVHKGSALAAPLPVLPPPAPSSVSAVRTMATATPVAPANSPRSSLRWPRAETPTNYIAMGFDKDLKTATEIAVRNMIAFLSDPAQAAAHPAFAPLTLDDAYALVSTACDVNISELVDTNDGVHVLCPKALFTAR